MRISALHLNRHISHALQARHSGPVAPARLPSKPPAPDLPKLDSPKGRELAGMLCSFLDAEGFDALNQRARGQDYTRAPFVYHPQFWQAALATNGQIPGFTVRQLDLLSFFYLGSNMAPPHVQRIFGARYNAFLERGLDTGLFAKFADGTIGLDGIGLISFELPDKRVAYSFVDLFKQMPWNPYRPRVHAGTDTYTFTRHLVNDPACHGLVSEGGAGSAFPSIRAVLENPRIEKVIGFENDRRSVQMARFNIAMHGLDSKIVMTETVDEMDRERAGRKFDFAFCNPPFCAVAQWVPVPDGEVGLLKEHVEIHYQDHQWWVNMLTLLSAGGWTGPDGMDVIRYFLDVYQPRLTDDGEILMYGSFTGNERGPGAACDESVKRGFDGTRWGAMVFVDRTRPPTRVEWADNIAKLLSAHNPQLAGTEFLNNVSLMTIHQMKKLGITHVHEGLIHFRR